MRDLNVEEQCRVAGGMAASTEQIGWVPNNVLVTLGVGSVTIGGGAIGLPIRMPPGLIPGPVFMPSPITTRGPGGLPYDC